MGTRMRTRSLTREQDSPRLQFDCVTSLRSEAGYHDSVDSTAALSDTLEYSFAFQGKNVSPVKPLSKRPKDEYPIQKKHPLVRPEEIGQSPLDDTDASLLALPLRVHWSDCVSLRDGQRPLIPSGKTEREVTHETC